MASESRGLSLVCGLSGRKGRVGQEACRWSVVCRGENAAWVKEIVASVWSVGAKTLSGSRGLSVECGLSWQKRCVGQRNCCCSVVCRAKTLCGSRELLAECGLSWRKGRVGQRNCRWHVVCRGEKGEWVKKASGVVWFSGRNRRVGQEGQRRSVVCRAKTLRGLRGLSVECGLSGQKRCVGQEACRRSVVCRGEKGEWVKRPVGGVWSVRASLASGSRGLSAECGLSWRKGRVGQKACR